MSKGNGPAFPVDQASYALSPTFAPRGLTKREYFAAMAMQGWLTSPRRVVSSFEAIAVDSVGMADALITELEKTK